MSALEMIGTFEKNFSGKRIININTKTERQLRSITEDKGLRGYYKLKKADLVASLLEQSTEEMPTPPPRSSMSGLHDSAKKTLKGDVESEANKANQEEEDIDLTPHEKERAFKGAFKSFMIPGAPKTGIDSYFDQAKPHIKTLIKNQLKEIGSAKIIMTIWVRWKKPIMPLLELGTEDAENAQEINGNTGDNCIKVEMPFNSLMTEFFEGNDINESMQHMLAHIKTQVENPRMPDSGLMLDKILDLYISFHRLALA